MLKTLILVTLLGYVVQAAIMKMPPISLGKNPCIDRNGVKHENGEEFVMGKCTPCVCHDGEPVCAVVDCFPPQAAKFTICHVRPGTEDQCCPEYYCEDKPSCLDSKGKKRGHGERWKEGKCKKCRCSNGVRTCRSPRCRGPPAGKQCTVRPGTENKCCRQYDCKEEGKPCLDSDGKERAEGEKWKEGKCEYCRCNNGKSGCASPRCMGPPAGEKCTVRPGTENECCQQYNCEEEVKPCIDSEGNKHAHGEDWKEGKCKKCRCSNGFSACTSPRCMGPPLGKQCTVRPGTENNCCKQYDCQEALSLCPAGSLVAPSCPDSLCDHCEDHPNAKCRISRCGGCSAKFYENGVLVQCAGGPVAIKPKCPPGPVINCLVRPCHFGVGGCDPHPSTICHVNYCDQCEAVYYDNNNEELDCRPLKGK